MLFIFQKYFGTPSKGPLHDVFCVTPQKSPKSPCTAGCAPKVQFIPISERCGNNPGNDAEMGILMTATYYCFRIVERSGSYLQRWGNGNPDDNKKMTSNDPGTSGGILENTVGVLTILIRNNCHDQDHRHKGSRNKLSRIAPN